jgi:hypothetical protein
VRRTIVSVGAAFVAVVALAPPAVADREPFPHEFHHNMGYCAPYLAQLRLPDGSPVRPFINHVIRDLTAGDQTFEGQQNVGDLYSDRARSETDTTCVPRA